MKNTIKHYDAAVIGVGLTGSWAVKELSEGGLNVVALDAGPLLSSDYFLDPMLDGEIFNFKNQLYRLRLLLRGNHNKTFHKALFSRTQKLYTNEKDFPYTTPPGIKYRWMRSRTVGGRGHVWGRVCPRFNDKVFKSDRSQDISFNWPLRLSDLEPYYKEIEMEMELGGAPSRSGRLENGIHVHGRSFNENEKLFIQAIEKRWNNRLFDVLPVLQYDPGPLSPMLISGINTERVTLMPNTVASKLINDNDGLIRGVEYINSNNNKIGRISADVIVLSASPFETIRLLKSSVSAKHSDGLGNSSGLLGKYIIEQVHSSYVGILPKNMIDNRLINTLNPFKLNADPHGFYVPPFRRFESNSLDYQGDYGIQGGLSPTQKILFLDIFGESTPRITNFVEIDHNKKDKLGLPVPKISYQWDENDKRMWQDQNKIIKEMIYEFENANKVKMRYHPTTLAANYLTKGKMPLPGGAIHESGGARMGRTNKLSIVNPFNRIWDSPNVLVCDSSCFPSSGYQNPSLTAMALCLRACRNILKIVKNNGDLYKI